VHSLLIALGLAVAAYLGVFTAVDGRLYDVFVRHMPDRVPKARQVVLIDSPVGAFFSASFPWNTLTQELLALGARQVVFTVLPEGDPRVVEALLQNPKVVVGSDLAPDPDRMDTERFNLPDSVAGLLLPAVADTPEPLLGVHRYQLYSFTVEGRTVPSIEALAAQRVGLTVPLNGRYLVNFSGSGMNHPRAKLAQVAQGRLTKEFVADRIVLIGIGHERFHREVVTPITDATRQISKLEFHGYALDSLLNGSGIASVPPVVKALLLLAVWLVFYIVAQPMNFRTIMITATLMVAGLVAIAWLSLATLRLHVPVLGAMLVIGTTLVLIVQKKAQHHDRELERLVNTVNVANDRRLRLLAIPRGEDFWPYAMGMVDQAVPITRAVLFKRVPGTSRMRPVQYLRCTEGELMSAPPDLGEPSYVLAFQTGELVDISSSLSAFPGEEHRFVAPLVSDGQTVGCLAFGTGVGPQERATVLRAVGTLCKRLSEMMSDSQQRTTRVATGISPYVRMYLNDDRNEAIQALTRHLQIAHNYGSFLEAVLNRVETPTIVYDLFGRPLFANSGMKSVLTRACLSEDGSSAASEVIEQVCGISGDEARLVLSHLSIDGHAIERRAWAGTQQYVLKAETLGDTSLSDTTYRAMLQEAHGLHLQLLRAEVPQVELPRHTAGPDVALASDGLADPTDVWVAVESAVAKIKQLREFDALTLTVEGNHQPAPVRSQARALDELMFALVQLLAYDSRLPAETTISVERGEGEVSVVMHNQGYGMPEERLQAMLNGPIWPQSPTLRRIRQLHEQFLGSEGSLSLFSSVGTGYRAVLKMKLLG
jgi:CHASE2 domain-containing sensor protein